MAKQKEQPKVEKKVEVPKEEKPSFFPRLLILFSLLLIALAVISFFDFISLPDYIFDVALLLAGLWMFKLALAKGMYKRRKEILKRYI